MIPTRMVYRVSEVAALLGVQRSTVYDLIRAGELRARQQRRFLVVTADDLAAYVNALPIKPSEADDAAPEPAPMPALPVRARRGRVVRLLDVTAGLPGATTPPTAAGRAGQGGRAG